MATMYKSRLNIGEKEKTVVVVNYKTETEMTQQKSVDCLHHIEILDRSGSMSGSIKELIENVKQTIEFIPDNDYVSIVWFSGAGQFKTLIKGAKKDTGLFKLLDGIAYTIGCTCFSEPLQEVGVIISDLKTICPNFNVILFTDGQPVVPWSDEEEIKRIFKAINVWKDDAIAINTVGYGNYYNEKLLKDISAISQFGQMVHSSKINEYMDIFSHNYERVAELVMDSVQIDSINSEIIYLNSKTSKMSVDTLKMSMLEKKKNQFILISDSDSFEFTMNNEIYKTIDIKNVIPITSQIPILYAYAYENYYVGNRQYALDTLAKTLKDKFLVDEQIKAFTFDECSEYMKKFKKAMFSSKGRLLEGECEESYIPRDDAPCVMDILKILTKGDNYYVYSEEYKRIGVKTVDNFNLFEKSKGIIISPINELIFNKEKLNISIRSKILGTVKINPNVASRVNLPNTIDSHIYRNQTIIKDGNLNINTIRVIISEDTLKSLNSLKIQDLISIVEINEDTKHDITDYIMIDLNLNTIPIINRTYLSNVGDTSDILKNTWDIILLGAQQKVANYFLKMTKKAYTDTIGTGIGKASIYTLEQLDVLKDHGLDSNLGYTEIDRVKETVKDEDYYEARELSFDIKGYASLPSVPDVIKKIKESDKLNGPGTLMKNYIMELQQDINMNIVDDESTPISLLEKSICFNGDYEYFEKEAKQIKNDILEKRIEMCSMKIAKVLTGDWFTGLIPDGKGNYNYISEGKTLVVKTEKVKVFFS